MIRSRFHAELSQLERDVVVAASAACQVVDRAARAASGDLTAVVDDVVGVQRGVDVRAYALIARNQPTAGDLRAVMTAVRVVRELERVDGLARHVVLASRRVPRDELTPRLRGLLADLARSSRDAFARAIDAYAERDEVTAGALRVLDDEVDDLHRTLIAELLSARLATATTVQLALLARYLERIADHAVTIGGRVGYLVTGDLAPG